MTRISASEMQLRDVVRPTGCDGAYSCSTVVLVTKGTVEFFRPYILTGLQLGDRVITYIGTETFSTYRNNTEKNWDLLSRQDEA
jgi:hypothetical protein